MKRIIKLLLAVVLSVFCASIASFSVSLARMQSSFDSELYGNVIRLHILAESDSEQDQKAKLEIKNCVIERISQLISDARNADHAASIIDTNVPGINEYVQQVSCDLGYDYDIKTHFSEEKYPVRYYDGFAFPAGTYKSLRITLGSGKGKNWWCVLYPSICVSPVDEADELLAEAGLSEKTVKYICEDEKYKIRFRFLELLGL